VDCGFVDSGQKGNSNNTSWGLCDSVIFHRLRIAKRAREEVVLKKHSSVLTPLHFLDKIRCLMNCFNVLSLTKNRLGKILLLLQR